MAARVMGFVSGIAVLVGSVAQSDEGVVDDAQAQQQRRGHLAYVWHGLPGHGCQAQMPRSLGVPLQSQDLALQCIALCPQFAQPFHA